MILFISKLKTKLFDGIFRSNIHSKFWWCYCSWYWYLVDLENEATGQSPFFRDDYANEVIRVEQIISNINNGVGHVLSFLNDHPELGKQVLQHIYTFDQNSFNKLKESISFARANKQEKRDKSFEEFYVKMRTKCNELEYETKPEFGACKECWKYLDAHQKKKYNHLNRMDDNFWDCTEW